jgi:hypothetical protein
VFVAGFSWLRHGSGRGANTDQQHEEQHKQTAFPHSSAIGLLDLLAFVQFLWLLFAGEPNQFLLRFGRSLSLWLADAARFLSCANDEMPFPWKAWPDVE